MSFFLLLFLLAVGGVCGVRAGRLAARARLRERGRRARRGEAAAVRLLRRRGYRVVQAQPRARVEVLVDGEAVAFEVRADLLVRRWWRRYVVEVKTGRRAPRLDHRPTRRQLLEYARAFRTCGLLLVDPERGRIRRIRFL